MLGGPPGKLIIVPVNAPLTGEPVQAANINAAATELAGQAVQTGVRGTRLRRCRSLRRSTPRYFRVGPVRRTIHQSHWSRSRGRFSLHTKIDKARLLAPLCCQEARMVAGVACGRGPGCGLIEELVVGVGPAALILLVAPMCPPGPRTC
jgi:hypothetical protein